ncbi:MAG: hypothetical protein AAGM22_12720 [Acidobacteriota bacterium]
MSLHGFQQALSELVLSAELRAQILERGAAALGDFDLDARERRRVVAIAGQPGLDTGVLIHRSFRLSMQTRSLPRTCQLLGDRLSDLIHDYWKKNLPLHYNFAWEASRFAGYLRREQNDGRLVEPLLADVLRMDLAAVALQRGLPLDHVDLDPRPGGVDVVETPSPDRLVVVCRHDPKTLLSSLDAGERPAPDAGDYRITLIRDSSGGLRYEFD